MWWYLAQMSLQVLVEVVTLTPPYPLLILGFVVD